MKQAYVMIHGLLNLQDHVNLVGHGSSSSYDLHHVKNHIY